MPITGGMLHTRRRNLAPCNGVRLSLPTPASFESISHSESYRCNTRVGLKNCHRSFWGPGPFLQAGPAPPSERPLLEPPWSGTTTITSECCVCPQRCSLTVFHVLSFKDLFGKTWGTLLLNTRTKSNRRSMFWKSAWNTSTTLSKTKGKKLKMLMSLQSLSRRLQRVLQAGKWSQAPGNTPSLSLLGAGLPYHFPWTLPLPPHEPTPIQQ